MTKPLTIIRKFGYEYYLVEGSDRASYAFPKPNMFGLPNMTLVGCKKIGTPINKTKKKK